MSLLEILQAVQAGKLDPLDAQPKILALFDIHERRKDDNFVANMCLSYRHDFGLMSTEQRESLMFNAKEWLRALTNNLPYK